MPVVNQNKLVASISSGHTLTTAGPLDICKTPAPPAPAPVPLPYPNIALTVTPGPGYATKTFALATPIFKKGSKTALSNGDQPGVAMGVISGKIMGMAEATMQSSDVDAEGGGLVRSLDSSDGNS